MRKVLPLLLAFVFLLAVSSVFAQRARQRSTTTTTTTTTVTTTGPEHKIEGCIAKEQNDFFLIPQRGEPFRLQASANQDLGNDAGHRVTVSGKWLSGNSVHTATTDENTEHGTVAGQASSGTGNDLHRLSKRELVVDHVRSIADSCPVNWNPKARR